MANAGEIQLQIAQELRRRTRLAVPAFAGGLLYLLGSIIIASTLNAAPTVGLLQGLKPALSGEANPAVSPRAVEVKYISHHAFGLIAGSVLAGLAIAALTLALLLLYDAARFRRPETWSTARPLALFGGATVAVVSVGHQIVSAIQTHNFSVGHDLSNHAVDQTLTKGAANMIVQYVDLLAGLALAAGMIGVMINVQRVGLLPRWVSILGMLTAVLIFLPIGGAQLEIIPAFWLVAVGILFMGKWPNGDPPAWASGEARPWPTAAERRAEREEGAKTGAASKGRSANGQASQEQPALSTARSQPAPAPVAGGPSRRRRRKRGGRN
jgi:hypothetical protein